MFRKQVMPTVFVPDPHLLSFWDFADKKIILCNVIKNNYAEH